MRPNVKIISNWQADAVEVYVFDGPLTEGSAAPAMLHRHVEGDLWRIEEVGPNEAYTGRPKPSVSLPSSVVDALIAHAKNERPSLDRDDAVSDARKTRDRLLVLVENAMGASVDAS